MFTTFGEQSSALTTVYKRFASLLSVKKEQPYRLVMSWPQCSISFFLFYGQLNTFSCGLQWSAAEVSVYTMDEGKKVAVNFW